MVLSSSVPQHGVALTINHTGPLYAGASLTLTCTVTVNPNVDYSNVVIEWSRVPVGRSAVSPATRTTSSYIGTLTISPLTDEDGGTYTCIVTFTGETLTTASDSINISVRGE